jgi:hypothetical protein
MVHIVTNCENCSKKEVCKFYSSNVDYSNVEDAVEEEAKKAYTECGIGIMFPENITADDVFKLFNIRIECPQFVDRVQSCVHFKHIPTLTDDAEKIIDKTTK